MQTLEVNSAQGRSRSPKAKDAVKLTEMLVRTDKLTLTDLGLVGVPSDYQNRTPKSYTFPTKFNSGAKFIWDSIFKSPELLNIIRLKATPILQWNACVVQYMKMCKEADITPFVTDTSSDNEKVAVFLTKRRRLIIDFLRKMLIFKAFSIKGLKREFVAGESSLTVRISAQICKVSDYNDLIKFITNPRLGFKPTTNATYFKMLDASTFIYVRQKSSNQFFLIYEIRAYNRPEYKLNAKNITQKKYIAFIMNKIWMPIVRALPLKTPNSRNVLL